MDLSEVSENTGVYSHNKVQNVKLKGLRGEERSLDLRCMLHSWSSKYSRRRGFSKWVPSWMISKKCIIIRNAKRKSVQIQQTIVTYNDRGDNFMRYFTFQNGPYFYIYFYWCAKVSSISLDFVNKSINRVCWLISTCNFLKKSLKVPRIQIVRKKKFKA